MLKALALWYLNKRKAQVIMNIYFHNDTTVSGVYDNRYQVYGCDGRDLNIIRNVDEEREAE